MGQVWQATDTQLNRQVALKILPDAFADDPDRLARFKREAQILASLNHPNIAAIHGIEESEGTRALVLELVEGPTLADRISQGPIPVDEALPIAKQIAEALEAAHEAGVIHRDLKPANVKVKADGTVKVLDFGLAKALAPTPVGDPNEAPTLTAAATQMGVILGTAAYMSPEQARGKPVDKRADIWAFGCVLYEMLTGHRAFEGEDVSVTLANVIRDEPRWEQLPARVPSLARPLLESCLRKDTRQRLRDIGDVRLMLDGQLGLSPASVASAPDPRRSPAFVAIGFALALLAGIVGWTLATGDTHTPPPVTRFSIALPASDVMQTRDLVTMSPDGSRLVYSAVRSGTRQLFLSARDQLDAVPLPGTENGLEPFFSPDGSSIGFFTGTALKRLDLTSSAPTAPITLCEAASPRGGTWRTDDTIVFSSQANAGLMVVSASGGTAEPLTTPALDDGSHWHPFSLPDGSLLLTVRGDARLRRVAMVAHDGGEPQGLTEGVSPRWIEPGYLVFGRGTTLWAAPFDTDRAALTGEPVPVLEGVRMTLGGNASVFTTADDGTLAYQPVSQGTSDRTVVLVDRDGTETRLQGLTPGQYGHLSVSRDGTRAAVRVGEAGGLPDIRIYEFERALLTSLTTHPASDSFPLWVSGDQRVVFNSNRPGVGLYSKNADGTGETEHLLQSPTGVVVAPRSWWPEEESFLFEYASPGTGDDIHLFSLRDRESRPLLVTEHNELQSALSPGRDRIAYNSDLSGRPEIYIAEFPSFENRVLISRDGGREPLWSPDGDELFYRDLVGTSVRAVVVDGMGPGEPQVLFEGAYGIFEGVRWRTYDVLPDGRFILVRPLPAAPGTSRRDIVVVQQWLAELTDRVSG